MARQLALLCRFIRQATCDKLRVIPHDMLQEERVLSCQRHLQVANGDRPTAPARPVRDQGSGHGRMQTEEEWDHPIAHKAAPHLHFGTVSLQFTLVCVFPFHQSCNCAYSDFH